MVYYLYNKYLVNISSLLLLFGRGWERHWNNKYVGFGAFEQKIRKKVEQELNLTWPLRILDNQAYLPENLLCSYNCIQAWKSTASLRYSHLIAFPAHSTAVSIFVTSNWSLFFLNFGSIFQDHHRRRIPCSFDKLYLGTLRYSDFLVL